MQFTFTLELDELAACPFWRTCRLENPFCFTSGHFWAGKHLGVSWHHLGFSLCDSKNGFPQEVCPFAFKREFNRPKPIQNLLLILADVLT